jgi:DNA (cytosine-5)-methyltransferase 1
MVPEVAATLRGGGSTDASHGKQSGSDEGTLVVAATLRAARNHHENLVECVTGQITHALTSEGADASEDGTGRGTPIVLSVAENQRSEVVLSDQTQALSAGGGKPGQGYPAILFNHQSGGSSMQLSPQTEVANTLVANQTQAALVENYRVRRLTPMECERLQGFPDERTLVPIGWTRGKKPKQKMASDSVRYRALGNSMAVVIMRWLANRIDFVHHLVLP